MGSRIVLVFRGEMRLAANMMGGGIRLELYITASQASREVPASVSQASCMCSLGKGSFRIPFCLNEPTFPPFYDDQPSPAITHYYIRLGTSQRGQTHLLSGPPISIKGRHPNTQSPYMNLLPPLPPTTRALTRV